MSFKCKIGLHTWIGCKCSKCDKSRDKLHDWSAFKCNNCGQTRVPSESEMISILVADCKISGGYFKFSSDVKSIGKYLNKKGGYNLMLQIANKAVERGAKSSWMNEAWDGIGTWRS